MARSPSTYGSSEHQSAPESELPTRAILAGLAIADVEADTGKHNSVENK